jgi:H+-translocating NAD(P) transhydrogenase subunit beta
MSAMIPFAYLISAVTFVVGLKLMSAERTAVQGNFVGAAGMIIAILVTLLDRSVENYLFIAMGLIGGTVIGSSIANQVKALAMPQMVGMLNGLGSCASMLVAFSYLLQHDNQPTDTLIAVGLSSLFGAIAFCGSLVAYAKLEEWPSFNKPFALPQPQAINLALLVLDLLLVAAIPAFESEAAQVVCCLLVLVVASVLGVILVNPFETLDIPVVISLMNACSGMAVAATGFVLDNNALIISGSMVGASAITLTQIMCKVQNRSMSSVIFGDMLVSSSDSKIEVVDAVDQSTSPECQSPKCQSSTSPEAKPSS